MSREPKRLGALGTIIALLVILGIIAATGFVVWLCVDMVNKTPDNTLSTDQSVELPLETGAAPVTEEPTETTEPPVTTEPPQPETVVATATIASQGDLLMHKPVFDTCRQGDGSYNFESIFRYSKDLIASYDYALANLETTFGGDDFVYQGNPAFNCPDELADSVVEAGYDMLLTANNHCGDTMKAGVIRTLEHTRSKGLATLGTQLNDQEPKHAIVDINGIKVGMVCYSWAYNYNGSSVSMNGLTPIKDEGIINFFTNANPDKLYTECKAIMEWMKGEGAEATMIFIHWGNEYELTENALQRKIAQNLCDIGFDVIVGGHAHVVQPMALLESTVDPDHKTVCIYSMGNAVSNQRTGVSDQFPTGYTEDGALFTVSFEKYSDGKVYVSGTDVVPTWVNMHSNKGAREYNILPLTKDTEQQWQSSYELTDQQLKSCQKSYDRTMGIVGEGLEACRTYLAQAKDTRDAYYYNLAYNPGLLETQAAEAPVAEETLPAA